MGKVSNKHEEVCICKVWSAALSKKIFYFYKHICRGLNTTFFGGVSVLLVLQSVLINSVNLQN